jgi:phage terminase large subunit-like protein
VAFFSEALVHTKGDYYGKPFRPSRWQRDEVLAPLFGEVFYDEPRQRYVRRYRLLYLCVARKNGKSELIAGMVLYLLVADGERGAEIYGLALDMNQAGLVYNVARQMVRLSPSLAERLDVRHSVRRIVDEATGSFYSVVASDALGNLGSNPSAGYIDELLAQPNRDLYDVLRTGLGTRAQPLIMLATTAESDSMGFAASERQWSQRVREDPQLEPERLSVIFQANEKADWTLPSTWRQANPALGDFLDIRTLTAECHAAKGNPVQERAFRQFRLNQPVTSVGRAITIPIWDASAGERTVTQIAEDFAGRTCFGGLDLASTQDLAAYALVFPDDEGGYSILWRHFLPSAAFVDLAKRTGGAASLWVSQGLLTVTEGNVLDYAAIKTALAIDRDRYPIQQLAFDRWQAIQLSGELMEAGWPMRAYEQGFGAMAAPTSELLRLVGLGLFHHGGSQIMRWQAGNAVTQSDATGNIRFSKAKSMEKIDGLVAAVMGLDGAVRAEAPRTSAYESAGLTVV